MKLCKHFQKSISLHGYLGVTDLVSPLICILCSTPKFDNIYFTEASRRYREKKRQEKMGIVQATKNNWRCQDCRTYKRAIGSALCSKCGPGNYKVSKNK